MAGIFGGGSSTSAKIQPATSLRVQTSLEGKAVAIGWGRSRLGGNLIWYGDFVAKADKASGGGKGGGGGGKGGKGGTSGYTYSAAVVIALCEGPVAAISDTVWTNQSTATASSLNLTTFLGDYSQTPWGYLNTHHAAQALGYRGMAYACAGPMDMGSSPALPNINFEITFGGPYSDGLPGRPDANPATVISDYLTNVDWGAAFPANYLGDLAVYRSYCLVTALLVSPVLSDQAEGRQFLKDLLEATNCEAVWSDGKLSVVPYGDQTISANGAVYTAPSAPLYLLGDADFKPLQGSNTNSTSSVTSSDPVAYSRLAPATQMNAWPVEYLDRSNAYNPAVVQAQDDAAIAAFGLRMADKKQVHFFAQQDTAVMSAELTKGRAQVRGSHAFTVGQEFILLDPMDIIAITDVELGVVDQWVRITEITENQDNTLTIQADEYLGGTGASPVYAMQAPAGFNPSYNTPPPQPWATLIWEPTYAMAGAFEIWIAAAGASNWGGCDIWVSTDDETYRYIGTLFSVSRMGVSTVALPAIAAATTGATIDQTNTLAVDMAASSAQLATAAPADALNANTLCYIDGGNGEYLAYAIATLTSGDAYDLTYLNRGLFDTPPQAHPQGTPFVRLVDGTFFRFPMTEDRIGAQFYFKLLPFNQYGAGRPDLSDVPSALYTVQGTALIAPLPNIADLTTSYVARYTSLSWTEVQDFRRPIYEIRKGANWEGSQRVARVAHPPFRVFGSDTYWVAAYANPAPGVEVYSPAPADVTISGSVYGPYILATFDEAASGWSGALGGSATVTGSFIQSAGAGSYEIPAGHVVDIGRVAVCDIVIDYVGIGELAGDVLALTDWLSVTDFLGLTGTKNTAIYPEIAVSQDGTSWGAWATFIPGGYSGRAFKLRMQINSTDPQTLAVLEEFSFSVMPPERDDHVINLAVATGGTAITFKPDGSASAAPFNSGPNGATQPNVQATILGASAGDDLLITGLSLSGCTVQVLNGGVGVARNVNLLIQGS